MALPFCSTDPDCRCEVSTWTCWAGFRPAACGATRFGTGTDFADLAAGFVPPAARGDLRPDVRFAAAVLTNFTADISGSSGFAAGKVFAESKKLMRLGLADLGRAALRRARLFSTHGSVLLLLGPVRFFRN
jgi:hypothetical protein